jgi:hypothetical protein
MQTRKTSSGVLRRWIALWLQDRRRARAATHLGPTVPNAPANLALSDVSNFIQLTWSDMSTDEQGFHVYRNADFAGFVIWRILGPNVTQVQDTGVAVGHTYAYYVVAFNAVGESAPSNIVSELYGS